MMSPAPPTAMNVFEKKVKRFTDDCNSGKRKGYSQAARCFCLSCTGYDSKAVKGCVSRDCPLWGFRFGRNNTGKKRT